MATRNRGSNAAHTRATKQRKRLFVSDWRVARGCRDCGEIDPVVLDCHHVDPAEKNPRLIYGVGLTNLSWAELEAELDKCVVLCANCHRREEARK